MSSLNLTEASDPCLLGLSFPIIHSLLIPVQICLYPHPSADAASQQSHSLTRVSVLILLASATPLSSGSHDTVLTCDPSILPLHQLLSLYFPNVGVLTPSSS